MAGCLTNDISRLMGVIVNACKETNCGDCMFLKYTECPNQLVVNAVTSVGELRRAVTSVEELRSAITRCENILKEQV